MYVKDVKNLLINTDSPMSEIAKKYKVSARTVSNINQGKTYFDEKLDYPLRITGQRINKLKEKLSKPTKKAVLNPHILSPQLLDYIGFLSILDVGIECLLVFKDVYYKELKVIFNRELSDKEIISIIELRPQRPAKLEKMINAYYNPRVRLMNKEYWLKEGIITERESEIIYSLLTRR